MLLNAVVVGSLRKTMVCWQKNEISD